MKLIRYDDGRTLQDVKNDYPGWYIFDTMDGWAVFETMDEYYTWCNQV